MIGENLTAGQTYQNRRRDFLGPMDERTPGVFLDQYGNGYDRRGIQWGHTERSTANINLTTAGTKDGWRDEVAYVRTEVKALDQEPKG